VAALTLGLVKGNSWGWGSTATLVSLIGAGLALAVFVLRTVRHDNPLISPDLFRVRTFTGASVVSVLFSVAFGAMLFSVVLWGQDVWGWSALTTGLALAPGPLMVPLFAFVVAGPLIARFGPGPVIAAGSTVFAAGVAWWVLATGLAPNYLGETLGGTILTGIGVGLTLPTFVATGASSLPPQAFATGSAVVNMLRQVGLAVGVAVLVAVLGTPTTGAEQLTAFHRGWTVTAAVALASALAGLLLLRPAGAARRAAPAPAEEAVSRACPAQRGAGGPGGDTTSRPVGCRCSSSSSCQ
jgi:MFS family permease